MVPGELISGKFFLQGEMIETKLSEYLGLNALAVYMLIGNKQTGKKSHDENLVCIATDATHLVERRMFAKGVFRLWAYRLIAVKTWGGGRRHDPSRFQLINKWRTLIRMPDRLEKIHRLVNQYEQIKRNKPNPPLKKKQSFRDIKERIRNVIV